MFWYKLLFGIRSIWIPCTVLYPCNRKVHPHFAQAHQLFPPLSNFWVFKGKRKGGVREIRDLHIKIGKWKPHTKKDRNMITTKMTILKEVCLILLRGKWILRGKIWGKRKLNHQPWTVSISFYQHGKSWKSFCFANNTIQNNKGLTICGWKNSECITWIKSIAKIKCNFYMLSGQVKKRHLILNVYQGLGHSTNNVINCNIWILM